MADRDHEGDVLDGDFAAFFSQIEVEFVDLVGDLAGFRASTLDEELESFALECEFFVTGDAGHDAGDLFFPTFLGDVNLVVGLVFGVFLGPFAKAADAVDSGGAEEEVDAIGEVVLEDFQKVFDAGEGALGFAGAVGAEEIGPFEPDHLIGREKAEGLQGLDGGRAFLEGRLGIIGDSFDDLVGEIVTSGSLEALEEGGGFLGNAAFIGSGDDVNWHNFF